MSRHVTRTTLPGMTHVPPPAEELRFLDAELRQLDARRAQLLHRRAWLVAALQAAVPASPTNRTNPVRRVPPDPPRPEATAPGVQNLLLLLGGVLLTLAAAVFTLVSWGDMGIAGRALVLGAVTAAALGAPVPLLRRGLRSTAESVAGLGLALTVLDAYAVHQVAFAGADTAAYTAIASALLAALWTAYGLLPLVSGLRLPLPAALAAAQLPLLCWAISVSAGSYVITAALLLTAGFDTVVALRVTARSVRVPAVVGAYGMGTWGVPAAGWLSWGAAGPSAAARAAALLLLAAAIALGAAWRLPNAALPTGNALAGCLLLVAAGGGVLRVTLPGGWTVPGYLACGVALLATVRTRLPEHLRQGAVQASGTVQAAAVTCALPLFAVALLGPLGWVAQPWSGVPSDARAAATVHTPWPPYPWQLLLGPVAVAAVLAFLVRDETRRPWAVTGSACLAWATVMAVPAAFQLPYTAALLLQGAATGAALAAAAFRLLPTTTTALALGGSVPLAFLSLPSQTATVAVLSVLTAALAAASARPHLAPLTAPASLVYGTALACATGAAAGWQTQHTALLVLVVPLSAALVAPRLAGPHARVPVEVTGAVAGLLAIGLAITVPPVLALVLALCGVIAAGTAVRADRRPVGYAAAVLFVLASWVRLASWDVGTVEAYTLPVTVPALCVGAWRRHRDPRASSWTAYGAGLAATLLPSLVAAWHDPHWTRPLLLGAAALLLTLLGARRRLQAPLVLGGSVLVLDTLHELAPYLVQMTGALPRWVPPALAGLLLLALGATYEQRIRDVRRVREVLGRMS
ncbi:SCO7613 C-terminal domain-containing membrane protein [Streptomyces sp. NPDC050523]|uniref:SCO7613 C-terminal domain-containing membrane protein n=1 Tax=Streptomyces sp. NPDC050523 TaxID=3365622 RepID=UPI00378C3CB8